MSYLPHYADTDLSSTGTGRAGSGQTGARGGPGAAGMVSEGWTGHALCRLPAGIRGGAGVRGFQAGIEAGQRVLGNRAFLQWVRELHSMGQDAAAPDSLPPCLRAGQALRKQRAPLQMMPGKKKKPVAVEVEAGFGEQAAGAAGDAGAGAEGKAGPVPDKVQPQATGTVPGVEPGPVGGAAAGAKKKKKSRVQVALNTLRAEGVARFGGYIEAEIGETGLLHTLAERIMRAEDLAGVRKEALGMVEARRRLLDPEGGARLPGPVAPAPGQAPCSPRQGQDREEPEIAAVAPVMSEFTGKEWDLIEACAAGNAGRCRRLLKRGVADINMADSDGTLLCHAAVEGYANIVRELLSMPGVDVNLAGQARATPLFLAAWNGNAKVVEVLLGARGINVNLATAAGATPLYIAAERGHMEVVKLLLAAPGINVNRQRWDKATPLFVAADMGYLEVVKLLLAAPAINVNPVAPDGGTPLMMATQNGDEKMVDLLLAAPGINIDIQAPDGVTVLYVAAQENYPGIVGRLIRWGADVNLAPSEGATPLYLAAYCGYPEVARILLQAPGIRVNPVTDKMFTPLGVAVQHGHKDIVRLLLRHGADPNIIIKAGITPFHIACLAGNQAIVQMMLYYGADTDAELTDFHGQAHTPYSLAGLGGHPGVLSVLAAHRRRREPARRLAQSSMTGAPGGGAGTLPPVSATGVDGETDATGASVSPVPATLPPPGVAAPGTEPPSPLAKAQDALRQEVLGKLRADNLEPLEGIRLLEDVNDAESLDALCVLYNKLAHIERQKERARRQRRRMGKYGGAKTARAQAGPGTLVFALGGKTGLDADAVEDEITGHLGQAYHRFVSQAVNDMEFGRGKPTSGYRELRHASAGIIGVGSCSVFYYLDAAWNQIRIVGIGHHVGPAAYRLDYGAEELGGAGRILSIA